MPYTYTQLYVHVIFAVKGRANLMAKTWKENLYQYITGIITNKNQKLMIINGMPDHIHILIGLKPECNLSGLIRDVKANSSKWINENKLVTGKKLLRVLPCVSVSSLPAIISLLYFSNYLSLPIRPVAICLRSVLRLSLILTLSSDSNALFMYS